MTMTMAMPAVLVTRLSAYGKTVEGVMRRAEGQRIAAKRLNDTAVVMVSRVAFGQSQERAANISELTDLSVDLCRWIRSNFPSDTNFILTVCGGIEATHENALAQLGCDEHL